jgi:CRISPR-associated protein Cmr2
MSDQHLILVSLGPVQDFIAAARRMRDLWFGSHILSEVSKAAASSIADDGGTLIFPALSKGASELKPTDSPFSQNGTPAYNVGNKILALLPQSTATDTQTLTPERVAQNARSAALKRLQNIADQVRNKYHTLLADDLQKASNASHEQRYDDLWNEQIDTFLEFYATWTSESFDIDKPEAYLNARKELEQSLAARKNLREFSVWHHQRKAAPKSSLDGVRDSVLGKNAHDKKQGTRLRIHGGIANDGEQLDAIGLVKRGGGQPEQFVPIVNVALANWLEIANQRAKTQMAALRQVCNNCRDGSIDFPRIDRTDLSWTQVFPYDAEIFLEERWLPLCKEIGFPVSQRNWFENHVQPVLADLRKAGLFEPQPYVACLIADGDKMGTFLDQLPNYQAQQAVSQRLSEFAGQARTIVEQYYKGLLIYAGGDDVLAFVCLSDVLDCAFKLQEAYEELMTQAQDELLQADPELELSDLPTLSVGLGIGHLHENMGSLLNVGRKAEKLAKGSHLSNPLEQRNALGIIVDKRSGGINQWRSQWYEDPVERLKQDIDLLHPDGQMSTGKVYEVAALLKRLPHPSAIQSLDIYKQSSWRDMLYQDVCRTIARSQKNTDDQAFQHSKTLTPADVGLVLPQASRGLSYEKLYRDIEEWCQRMLIAKLFTMTPK